MFKHYLYLSWLSLKRTPIVSVLMILAIAIGIGVTMTSLSIYHMMSANPIPQKSERLFHPQLQTLDGDRDLGRDGDNFPVQLTYMDADYLSKADFPARRTPSIHTGFSVHLNSSDYKPFVAAARLITPDFFAMFDVPFLYGQPWTEQQDTDAAPVIVLSRETSEKLYGNRNPVGEAVFLDDTVFTVTGVIDTWRPTIKFFDVNNGPFNAPEDMFIPFSLIPVMEITTWGNSSGWKFEPINSYQDRLKSEVLWTQFWVELNSEEEKQAYGDFLMAYMQEQQKQGRFNREKLEFKLNDVTTWLDYNDVVSEDNQVLVALSFMFLVVCIANILGMMLAKFLRRAPEAGVRRALGASKTQIFYQHLVEVSVLGLIGSVFGLLLAQLGLWGVRGTYDYYAPLATMDANMLLATPLIALAASLIAGIYPAWLVCRTPPAIYLKSQ